MDEEDTSTFVCPECGRPMKKRTVKSGALGSFETWDCTFCHP